MRRRIKTRIPSRILLRAVEKIADNPGIDTALDLLKDFIYSKFPGGRKAYKNPIYLVGGKIYRTIIEELYHYPVKSHTCDWDFLIFAKEIKTKNYKEGKTQSVLENVKIDIINGAYLQNTMDLDSYFEKVPFNIQCMAVEVKDFKLTTHLLGLPCVQKDILEKTMRVHNPSTMIGYWKVKGLLPEKQIRKKASSIKFNHDVSGIPEVDKSLPKYNPCSIKLTNTNF